MNDSDSKILPFLNHKYVMDIKCSGTVEGEGLVGLNSPTTFIARLDLFSRAPSGAQTQNK